MGRGKAIAVKRTKWRVKGEGEQVEIFEQRGK